MSANWPSWKNYRAFAARKAFLGSSTGTLLLSKPEDILAALKSGTRRVAVHSEDEDRLIARKHLAERGRPVTHPVWRDVETARLSTERVLGLAKKAGRRLHVLHVTTGDEIPLLAAAKDFATAETTPRHLALSAPECYERLGTYAQMNPPIRDESHRQALWGAIRDGVIDVIGSDHAPHTREEKDKIYPDTPSGMPGRADPGHAAAGSCQQRQYVPGAVCRPDSAWPTADFPGWPARAASRAAGMPISPSWT